MKTWITADWHLGETRMQLMQRPFDNADHMIDTIVRNHNRLVRPDDRVIVVGDACYQKTPERLARVADMHGHKTLVRGNHDAVFTDDALAPYFDTVHADGSGFEIRVGDIDCYVVHYPSCGRADRFNLVGHIHAAWKFQLNMVNVGVDVNHFLPVDLEEHVPFAFRAISEFYDRDVWSAYDVINERYRSERGKTSSYFDGEKRA